MDRGIVGRIKNDDCAYFTAQGLMVLFAVPRVWPPSSRASPASDIRPSTRVQSR
jgi:hypothetical protein